MFLGRHAHNLDAKGRLAIPARFREELAEGLVLTRGIDRCLALYPLAAWRPLADKLAALPMTDADVRKTLSRLRSLAKNRMPMGRALSAFTRANNGQLPADHGIHSIRPLLAASRSDKAPNGSR